MARPRLTPEENELFKKFLMPGAPASSFDVNESSSPMATRGLMPAPKSPAFALTMDDITRPPLTDRLLNEPAPMPEKTPQTTLPLVPKAEAAAKTPEVDEDADFLKTFLADTTKPAPEPGDNPLKVLGQALSGFADAQMARSGGQSNFLERTIKVQDATDAKAKEAAALREANDPNSAKSKSYQALMKEMFPGMDVSKLSAAQAEKVMGPLGQLVEKREARKAKAEEKREKAAEAAKAPAGYRWTADGNLEAIPGGPASTKTPEVQKKETAKSRVTGNLKQLSSLYKTLDKMGGIVDTEDKALVNVGRRVASSGLGQMTGKMFGTQEQSIRNQINQLRPLLLQDIRQASEMGARGLDSEKELEFYLQAATDPTADIQTNLKALDVLDRAYGLGMGIGDRGGPRAGSIEDGYRFKGGDASDPNNWEKVS